MLCYYASDSEVQLLDLQRSAQRRGLSRIPAAQQPPWDHLPELARVRGELAALPALVHHSDIRMLRQLLAKVESGGAHVLHVGECAELFTMADQDHVERRVMLYRRMANHLAERTGKGVVLIARMAGQHAKPRSESFMALPDGSRILNYEGDAVNGADPTALARVADPQRMLMSYRRSSETLGHVQAMRDAPPPVFVSHEALLRDYEEPMTRGDNVLYSGSGHLVWIGERTRNLWNWHVQWAALIANPVAVKIGQTSSPHDVVNLAQALNPWCEQGRLGLITRMGAGNLADRLGPIVNTVARAGLPVHWQCDPMHGNTRKVGDLKVRFLPDMRAEVSTFVRTLRRYGHHPAGLHIEVSPDDVHECGEDISDVSEMSSPPCDPRLNGDQAMDLVSYFTDELCR